MRSGLILVPREGDTDGWCLLHKYIMSTFFDDANKDLLLKSRACSSFALMEGTRSIHDCVAAKKSG